MAQNLVKGESLIGHHQYFCDQVLSQWIPSMLCRIREVIFDLFDEFLGLLLVERFRHEWSLAEQKVIEENPEAPNIDSFIILDAFVFPSRYEHFYW